MVNRRCEPGRDSGTNGYDPVEVEPTKGARKMADKGGLEGIVVASGGNLL